MRYAINLIKTASSGFNNIPYNVLKCRFELQFLNFVKHLSRVHTSNVNARKVRYAGAVEVFFPRWRTRLAVVAWNLRFFTLRLHLRLRCPGSHV